MFTLVAFGPPVLQRTPYGVLLIDLEFALALDDGAFLILD